MTQDKSQLPSIKDVPASTWEKLSQKKIYFGHRSVGNNIIQGIIDLMDENPQIKLDVIETEKLADINGGIFSHSKIGENGNPKSKIDQFSILMNHEMGVNVDIAFFKYCFVDINADTDVSRVFSYYTEVMSQLKEKFPKIRFVHMTVPLVTTRTTWKTWIKKILGKTDIWEYDHNAVRNHYNELLLKEYAGEEAVFDLAKAESTYPDGRRSSFHRNKRMYYSLVPEYTHDGGHLNEAGRKVVAEQLLILLTNLSN